MRNYEGNHVYEEELGCKSVKWNQRDIQWRTFYELLVSENVLRPMFVIWFKKSTEEMKDANYLLDDIEFPVREESLFGVTAFEFDVFIEHECTMYMITSSTESVIYLPSNQSLVDDYDKGCIDDDDDEMGNNDDDEEDSDDENVDRPKEDNKPVESEDERPVEKKLNAGNGEEEDTVDDLLSGSIDPNALDDGGDVVIDARDSRDDERFRTLFEEGERNGVENAYKGDSDEENDSDREFGLGDVMYLDNPLDTDKEWEQWDNVKGSRSRRKKIVPW